MRGTRAQRDPLLQRGEAGLCHAALHGGEQRDGRVVCVGRHPHAPLAGLAARLVRVGLGLGVGVKVGVGTGVRVRARARPASAAAPGISSTSSPIWAEDQHAAPSSHAPSECAVPPAETYRSGSSPVSPVTERSRVPTRRSGGRVSVKSLSVSCPRKVCCGMPSTSRAAEVLPEEGPAIMVISTPPTAPSTVAASPE